MCVPGRAKSATRRQSQRPATRARPINAERKALLLGTALVSTFLLGGMLAPSPIAAQTIVISQEQIRNNNAKRTTGLEAEITFSLARYNNLEADQSITLINDIVVNNSGDIDPVIAISADIYNYSVNFENFSPSDASDVSQENAIVNAIVVANSGGLIADDAGIVATVRNNDSVLFNEGFASNFDGGDFGIRDQTTEITQTNTLTNAIIVLNTDGDIVAGQDGIDASVHNSLLQIQNAAELFNDSFGDGDILTQIAEVEQANVLANLIEVGNGAAIVTNNSGIGAGILNDDVYLYNGCACGIGSINFGSADILSQTAETGQYNVLGNAIVIENDGDVVTGIAGISVAISNRRTELKNDALVLNENYGGADSAVQSAETNQINLAVNAIVIDNGGSLDPLNGIYAGIDNTDIRFLNEGDPYLGAPGNVASAGTPSFSTAQSGELLQSGDLTNTITIENRGAIDAGAGIIAQIRNVNAELENFFVFENVGELIITDSLAQSVELLQTNTVSNAIAVANTGPISAGLDGVRAEIDNEVLFLNEALLTNLADGNIGQLEQNDRRCPSQSGL